MKKTKHELALTLQEQLDHAILNFPCDIRKIKRQELLICLQRLGRIRNLLGIEKG